LCFVFCVLLLQKLLQEPQALLASADSWSTFKKHLTLVLGELSKCPATVPAVRPAPADAEAAGSAACTAAADGGSSKLEEEGAGSQCYLSSWKLFGLQLTDSGFRRDFLVQVGTGQAAEEGNSRQLRDFEY
jgi:hypothetical protein